MLLPEQPPPRHSLVHKLEVGKEVALSWDNFSLLPWTLRGPELDLRGHVFQDTLACPPVQVVQLKPSLLLQSRNVPVSPQI